jgi:hypothetical protein
MPGTTIKQLEWTHRFVAIFKLSWPENVIHPGIRRSTPDNPKGLSLLSDAHSNGCAFSARTSVASQDHSAGEDYLPRQTRRKEKACQNK